MLKYCHAKKTLAVSHVWSHSQGSRPESGINSCLHRRYCKIAKDYGCDSYWIDTACIPSQEPLRTTAIRTINEVFGNSKITLVCDKDIMDISLPDENHTMGWETITATLLVSDWKVRAWTLLESVKGSKNIHLLTRSNNVVSFKQGLNCLYSGGAIDLTVLLSAASHLIPDSPIHPGPHWGAKSFEEAGYLLSHRHASRVGDEIKIWSMLSVGKLYNNDEVGDFVSHVKTVKTAFLLSSSPRCPTRPFRWAPESPRLHPHAGHLRPNAEDYHSYNGDGSLPGRVSDGGFWASWLGYYIKSPEQLALLPNAATSEQKCWKVVRELFNAKTTRKIILLKAVNADGDKPYQGAFKRGNDRSPLVAVCVEDDQTLMGWVWQEVRPQPDDEESMNQWEIDELDHGPVTTQVGWSVWPILLV